MGASHTTRRLARPLALALVLTFVGSASPSAWQGAQARTPLPAPVLSAVVVDEPAASVTPIVPGSAPAPAVRVAATGTSAGEPTQADLADVLLAAYRSAATGSPAGCHLPVSLLAAIGEVESGSLVGRPLDRRHRTSVLGPVLDGHGFAAVADTDGGRWDGDTKWDRAVGPMQILPGTWRAFGVDGDGDGVADPQDVEDAAAGAADYLCFGGRDLSDPVALRRAVLSYNHSAAYLHLVTTYAGRFAALGLDDPDTTGLPTRLSLGATALPGEAPTATEPARTRHHAGRVPPKAAKAPKVAAAAAPAKRATAPAAPAEAPAPAEPAPAAPEAAPAAAPAAPAAAPAAPAAAAAPASPEAAPAAPATGETAPKPAPDPAPTTAPDPAPAPDACPTAPLDDPATPEDESKAPQDDATATAPTTADEPAADATPTDASAEAADEPCSPCPEDVDPTVEQPCLPAAVATGPAPSSAP